MQNDFLRRFLRRPFSGVDGYLGIRRHFVRIGDAGEFFQNSSPRLGKKPFAVTLLTDLNGCRNGNQNNPTEGLNHLPHVLPSREKRGNRGKNRDNRKSTRLTSSHMS